MTDTINVITAASGCLLLDTPYHVLTTVTLFWPE